jgi:choice-of-anchor A domain-containing protein
VKLYKYSIPLTILGIFILVIPFYLFNVNADQGSIYQIRILEINDNGPFDLQTELQGQKNITVDTIRMKQFVAQRDELNGKYDAIYIGKGAYSTTSAATFTAQNGVKQSDAHKTTTLMNDITHLKANEITDNYINKGLPVILHKDVLRQAANTTKTLKDQRILYDSFKKYSTTADQRSNVMFVDDNQLTTLISQMKSSPSPILTMMQQRPRIALDSVKNTLIDYSTNTDYNYRAGDKLVFPFQTHHIPSVDNNRIRASLYFSIDKVLLPEDYTLVATTNIDTVETNHQISYTLPKAYSGLIYWRLEVSDQITGLKDYITGTLRFKDERTVVNILQIMPTGETNGNLTKILDPTFLDSDSYKLVITPVTFEAFNERNKNTTKKLNGEYDMLVFGFRDEYNKYGSMSSASATAVKDFITTGQSVMFTHDTIYTAPTDTGNNNWQTWINNFQKDTGQIAPLTNLGLGSPIPSTTVSLVNQGLLTQYPFNLSKKTSAIDNILTVATTHNQYFTLNLEDPTVVPWYNIVGNSRDVNDSWNHYYTYSKGNVTYSGSGHTNSKFPLWEQQLFVNTMHRAFIGANHAPKITVNAPTNNSVKPSYLKNLMLSYTVNDWDLKDRNLYTSVKFTSDGKELPMGYKDKLTRSGDNLSQSFDNPLPDGGKLQIEITVKDAKGAQATEIINLTIEKATVNLETNRTLSPNVVDSKVSRGEEVIISYSIKPKNIPISIDKNDNALDQFIISDLKYKETFPPNLKVLFADTSNEANIKTTGDITSGMTVEKTFKDITYKLSEVNGIKSYIPDVNQSVSFDIKVTPAEKGVYNLVDSSLEYWDIHSKLKESPLGIARDYSIFMLGDISLGSNGFTSEGSIASAGNIVLNSGYNIGNSKSSTDDVLIAGNRIDIKTNGGTIHGNVVYGISKEIPDYTNIKGTVRQGLPINFNATRDQLYNLSSSLAALTVEGSTISENGGTKIKLTGINTKLNVFRVSGFDLNNTTNIDINVPKESTVIINVSGSSIILGNAGISLNGVPSNHIIYNFEEATTLNFSGIHLEGTFLAPKAAFTLSNGSYVGNYIGASLKPSSQGFHFKSVPFSGTLPSSIVTTNPINDPNKPDELTKVVFPDVGFEAIVKVSKLTLEDATILVGENLTLVPAIEPQDANNQIVEWISDRPEFVTVSSTGELLGLKPTVAGSPILITITSTDGSHISTTARVTVINPNLSISGPKEALVNKEINLLATYTTVRENVTSLVWKIKEANSNATITPVTQDPASQNEWNASFKATKSGSYTVVATLISDKHPEGVTTEHVIVVKLKGLSIEGATSITVGSTITLDAKVEPIDHKLEEFTWTIEGDGDTYADLIPTGTQSSIKLKGIKAIDNVTITVTAGGISASHDVKISTITGLQFSSAEITIWIDDSINLNTLLFPIPRSYPLDEIRDQLLWSFNSGSDTLGILSLNNNGTVKGLKKGSEIIKVTYSGDPTVMTTIKVIVASKPNDVDKY